MAQSMGRAVVVWQDKNKIKMKDLSQETTSEIGKGISPRVYYLPNGKVICVWEDDKVVRYKLV